MHRKFFKAEPILWAPTVSRVLHVETRALRSPPVAAASVPDPRLDSLSRYVSRGREVIEALGFSRMRLTAASPSAYHQSYRHPDSHQDQRHCNCNTSYKRLIQELFFYFWWNCMDLNDDKKILKDTKNSNLNDFDQPHHQWRYFLVYWNLVIIQSFFFFQLYVLFLLLFVVVWIVCVILWPKHYLQRVKKKRLYSESTKKNY